ncbi:hypothetical protein G3N57_01130 [Paraburkholderia sp. Se-20369]|nr:hypothetical protein [Paraburkholderia sp. Se-20369]
MNDSQTYSCVNEVEALFSRVSSEFITGHLAEEKESSGMSRTQSPSKIFQPQCRPDEIERPGVSDISMAAATDPNPKLTNLSKTRRFLLPAAATPSQVHDSRIAPIQFQLPRKTVSAHPSIYSLLRAFSQNTGLKADLALPAPSRFRV